LKESHPFYSITERIVHFFVLGALFFLSLMGMKRLFGTTPHVLYGQLFSALITLCFNPMSLFDCFTNLLLDYNG
jgi:cytochrome b subunit of formate dehydrogenase